MSDLALILVVVAISFFVKAITGFGGPLLAVPLLAPFLGVEHAVVAMAAGNLVSNVLLLVQTGSGSAETRRLLVRILVPGVITAVLGTIVLIELPDRVLLGALGIAVLVYIVIALSKPNLHLTYDRGLRISIPTGIVGGFMHGATGNSGTVFATFFHSMDLARKEFVFALTNVFLVLSLFQVGTLVARGSYTGERTIESLLAIIPVLLVTPLGTRVGRRLDAKTFGHLVLALLAVAGIRLLLGAFGI